MRPWPPVAGAPPLWVPYGAGACAAGGATQVGELGGKVYVQPTDIPGMGRFAVAADPHGAVFAMFQYA